MPSILFVCTGNIFRSMTAEYALKAMLNPHSPIRMSSAGTVALPQAMRPDVHAYILRRGIDPSQHQQRKVSAELLHASDCVIAMSRDHQAFLFDTFQYQAPLFNEVSHGRSESLLDVWEAIPIWETNLDAARTYALQNLENYLTVERAEQCVF